MVYDEILAYLSGEYRKGKTYQQIADEHGLSFGYIRDLIHGRNKVERMSLETFFKLFPSAQISLNGSAQSAPVSGDSLRHERELLELERAELAAQRRELEEARKNIELEKEIFELKKNAAASPRAPHAAEPVAPYRFAPAQESTLSPSK